MTGVNDWSQAERDLFAIGSRAAIEDLERQAEEWRSTAALDTTSTDDMIRAHNARVRQLEEDHKAWLTRFIDGDEGADTNVAAGARRDDASSPGTGHGHRQQPNPDPRAAELAEAERLKRMSMQEWAEVRKTLIRTSNGLFG